MKSHGIVHKNFDVAVISLRIRGGIRLKRCGLFPGRLIISSRIIFDSFGALFVLGNDYDENFVVCNGTLGVCTYVYLYLVAVSTV